MNQNNVNVITTEAGTEYVYEPVHNVGHSVFMGMGLILTCSLMCGILFYMLRARKLQYA